MLQYGKYVAPVPCLPIKKIAVVSLSAGQMESIFASFPDFNRFHSMLGDMFNAIVVPIQFANVHASPGLLSIQIVEQINLYLTAGFTVHAAQRNFRLGNQ